MIEKDIWRKCETSIERSCSYVASSCHLDEQGEVVALSENFVVQEGILQ